MKASEEIKKCSNDALQNVETVCLNTINSDMISVVLMAKLALESVEKEKGRRLMNNSEHIAQLMNH